MTLLHALPNRRLAIEQSLTVPSSAAGRGLRFSCRSAPPKLVVLNNALISATHSNGAPDPAREPERFVLWVENACLAFAINQGQQVSYWREEPQEVDTIFDGSWGKWAVVVKTGRFDLQALRGLLEFCRCPPGFKPLVLTAPGDEETARRHGIERVSWEESLTTGPPGSGGL